MSKSYKNDFTAEISFPLGGLGAGSVGLAGNGRLIDWEINNRPNRVSINSFTNFAIKAEDEEKVIDYRLLQGDLANDHMGTLHKGNHSWGYGHGPNRGTMAGLRHFDNVRFTGAFPMANVSFLDERFPGAVEMTAFNPFIPSNDADSSMPTSFFTFDIKNTEDKPLTYTIAFSLTNPLKSPGAHGYKQEGSRHKIILNSLETDTTSPDFGNVCMATDATEVSYQDYWYRGGWFDNLTMFINDFSAFGPFKNRVYDQPREGQPDTSVLGAKIRIEPGQSATLRFNLSWYVPNVWKYWEKVENWTLLDEKDRKTHWRNYYAKLFPSAEGVTDYCFDHWHRLHDATLAFKEALHTSTLPAPVLDAIQGNIATLKSTTCLRLTDGEFYAWEGVNRDIGSCEGTCQHVWNYAYALPFLFPKLERSARDIDLTYNLEDSGELRFRVMLPLGSKKSTFRACVDGQMGTVMKCYREWKISGDTPWLRRHWPDIQACIAYAWHPENQDRWDTHQTGVIWGRQHHTLDVELYGPNSWLTGFYHGALLAGAEMAEALGEPETAAMYRALVRKGHDWIEANTFNGRHYVQYIDVTNKALLDDFGGDASLNMEGGYWDEETAQIKYQIGDGCEIDQVLADWHADLMGLPHIFRQDNRKKALESLYALNFVSMREVDNPCRVFASNGEKGLIMCNWADPDSKPKISIPYTQEVMTGFEYAAAANMLQCGMEKEALDIVTAVRDRYDGKKRNPWAEIECGASYARAMASYSFLLVYSGFKYDMTRGMVGFIPKKQGQYFWSIDGAWGTVRLESDTIVFQMLYGTLTLKAFVHDLAKVRQVLLDATPLSFQTMNKGKHKEVLMALTLEAGQSLVIQG